MTLCNTGMVGLRSATTQFMRLFIWLIKYIAIAWDNILKEPIMTRTRRYIFICYDIVPQNIHVLPCISEVTRSYNTRRRVRYINVHVKRYRKISSLRHTKSQKLNDSRFILQLSLPNPLKPGLKSRMKMYIWLIIKLIDNLGVYYIRGLPVCELVNLNPESHLHTWSISVGRLGSYMTNSHQHVEILNVGFHRRLITTEIPF